MTNAHLSKSSPCQAIPHAARGPLSRVTIQASSATILKNCLQGTDHVGSSPAPFALEAGPSPLFLLPFSLPFALPFFSSLSLQRRTSFSSDPSNLLEGQHLKPVILLGIYHILFSGIGEATWVSVAAAGFLPQNSPVREASVSLRKPLPEMTAGLPPHSGRPQLFLMVAPVPSSFTSSLTSGPHLLALPSPSFSPSLSIPHTLLLEGRSVGYCLCVLLPKPAGPNISFKAFYKRHSMLNVPA